MTQSKYSIYALLTCFIIVVIVHFCYYPKWQKGGTEATISWDVSGYYLYLPSVFIHKDIQKLEFYPDIIEKYGPTPDFHQAFDHRSGNKILKYSCGQALIHSPFFFIAHLWASSSDKYPADGYSLPYQFMISMGSLIICFLGLIYLFKTLRSYFSDKVTAFTILLILIGTNYLNYSAIDGAMTHNTLFTLYAMLIYYSDRFYTTLKSRYILLCALLVGLCALIRPTDLIAILIPFLWGIDRPLLKSIKHRFTLLKENSKVIILGVLIVLCIGSIQLLYWRIVGHEWFIYSYEDQGFSWLSPHIFNGLLSYKSGWITYSPFIALVFFGLWYLRKLKNVYALTCLIFAACYIYITFAWDIWWYGGSLGQRSMVQAYPILCFPIATFIKNSFDFNRFWKLITSAFIVLFIYLNLWFTHQGHLGGYLHVGQMTKAYYWKTIGRFDFHPEVHKLLDSKEAFFNEPNNETSIGALIPQDSVACPIFNETVQVLGWCLNPDQQFSPTLRVDKPDTQQDWIRAKYKIKIGHKQWDMWRMSQLRIRAMNGDEIIKDNMIRLQRIVGDGASAEITVEMKWPDQPFDAIEAFAWNTESTLPLIIEKIEISTFDE